MAADMARRQRLQRLLAELLARSVMAQTASPGEGRPDHAVVQLVEPRLRP